MPLVVCSQREESNPQEDGAKEKTSEQDRTVTPIESYRFHRSDIGEGNGDSRAGVFPWPSVDPGKTVTPNNWIVQNRCSVARSCYAKTVRVSLDRTSWARRRHNTPGSATGERANASEHNESPTV